MIKLILIASLMSIPALAADKKDTRTPQVVVTPSPLPTTSITEGLSKYNVPAMQLSCIKANEGIMRCDSIDATCFIFKQGVSCYHKGY